MGTYRYVADFMYICLVLLRMPSQVNAITVFFFFQTASKEYLVLPHSFKAAIAITLAEQL